MLALEEDDGLEAGVALAERFAPSDLPGAIIATKPANAAVSAAVPATAQRRTRLTRATATSRWSAASRRRSDRSPMPGVLPRSLREP